MIGKVLTKVFGSKNERVVKELRQAVGRINDLEVTFSPLSDADLAAKTAIFRARFEKGETLDDLLPEAFAVVREAGKRVLGERHYDAQLIGGMVLHQGKIAEMKTGEGKTLTSTLPVYLNGLTGKGVHVVTVNDYLATRDMEWMGQIYQFLNLSSGKIIHNMADDERREAYAADVTYGTNNEFGFDYLRDNMKFELAQFCQRGFHYAIVDEVDSILIDEARTPLIISGPADISIEMYHQVDKIMHNFEKDTHYTVDEKARQAMLTDDGVSLGEELLEVDNLYEPRNMDQLHHLNQALKAHVLFKRDVDYIVNSNQVIIVDEFTGRTMEGRRYSDGLHQALEAKEQVKIEQESQTLASITFQNYFRMYDKLAGMTGTADTEAPEFKKIYDLEVVTIPTHRKMVRLDYPDVIYKNEAGKDRAIIDEIREVHATGQPVLVGTISIDTSEHIAKLLKKEGVPHSVLNAKHHEQEAEIIQQAGEHGRITIATNMAGRGTDIKLGEGVRELGGLHILGTSRHESRRIDNQLRGRSGRQGDPGSSRFYLSLGDDLLRVFGSDKLAGFMDKLGMEEDEPIEHPWISKSIENAQRKVEGHNFDIRKHLLEFDDVMNKQREIIYRQRREVLESEEVKATIEDMRLDMIDELVEQYIDDKVHPEEWDWSSIAEQVQKHFDIIPTFSDEEKKTCNREKLQRLVQVQAEAGYQAREAANGEENMRQLERLILLQQVDNHWKDHLLSMDHLKQGIGLRGYGQKKPIDEYKKDGFHLFGTMIHAVKEEVVELLYRAQVIDQEEVERMEAQLRQKRAEEIAQNQQSHAGSEEEEKRQPLRNEGKVGRNAPCPCGSGKKYKRCCGHL